MSNTSLRRHFAQMSNPGADTRYGGPGLGHRVADLGFEGQLQYVFGLPTLHLSVLQRIYHLDSDLPLSALMVLLEVARRQMESDHLSVADLARRLNMTAQVTGRALKRLSTGMGTDFNGTSKALVCFEDKSTPARGRASKEVHLTDRGGLLLEDFMCGHHGALESIRAS